MAPRENSNRDDELASEMPRLGSTCNMQAAHDLVSNGSSSKASQRAANVNDSASTTADTSRSQSRESVDNDYPPLEMQRIFDFIHELGAGMDEFKSRADKIEGVLDHLEIDGLRHADELKELKECFNQNDRGLAKLSDLTVRVEQCERKAHGFAELMEQRQADLLAAAAMDVEKACQDSLERYWAESGVAQVQKACEDALDILRLDLSVILAEPPRYEPKRQQPREFPSPKPSPLLSLQLGAGATRCKSLHSARGNGPIAKQVDAPTVAGGDNDMHLPTSGVTLNLADEGLGSADSGRLQHAYCDIDTLVELL